MASLNMIGPFKLNAERVDEIINKGIPEHTKCYK